MVSSYAQSGKLFEERRAANGVRQIPPTSTTRGGAAIDTGLHKDKIAFKPLPSQESMLQFKHASSDPDIDWLNRVPPSAQRFSQYEEHPVMVEAPYDDIPMSQLTDENASQHSGSQGNSATGSVPYKQSLYSGRQGVQQVALTRFQPRATPSRPPVTSSSSRFGHLSTPRHQRHLAVLSTPRANVSVASSSMSYQPRSQNKIERRSWSESLKASASTPFAPSRASAQQAATPVMLSQSSVTNTVYTPRRAGNDVGGRFSFSRTPMVDRSSELQPNMHASSRSSIVAFQVSSDKYVQEQMKKLDEKASAMQEMLAAMQASAVSEIIAVKTTTADDLDQASKNHVLQFEEQASKLREENVQAVKATFESLRFQLIDSCLPFMREKATSILASLTQGPSFLKMISPWSDRSKHVIKNEASDRSIPDRSTSNKLATAKEVTNNPIEPKATSTKLIATKIEAKTKSTEQKTTSNKLVAIAKKAKKKPIEPKIQTPSRRSKRNAASQSRPKIGNLTEVEDNRVSPLISASIRAKRQKRVDAVTPVSPARNTHTITQPSPESDEPCDVGAGRRTSVVANWMTPNPLKKKRKRLFGRISSEEDSMSSPDSYSISPRKNVKPDSDANASSSEPYPVSSRKNLKPACNDNTSAPESRTVSSRKHVKYDGNADAISSEPYRVSSHKKLKPDRNDSTNAPESHSVYSRKKLKLGSNRKARTIPSVHVNSVRRGPAAVPVTVRFTASRNKLKPAGTCTTHVNSSVQVKSAGRAPAAMPVTVRSKKGGLRSRKKSATRRAPAKAEAEDCFDFSF